MKTLSFILGLLVSFYSLAGMEAFEDGPLIQGYGKHAEVEHNLKTPEKITLKVVFDVSKSSGSEELNRKFDSLARFLNMHVANGFEADNIKLALVVHGKAGMDLLNKKAYNDKFDTRNPNRELLQLLMKHKVQVLLCGQSAAFYDIKNADLMRDVQMSLSAMTAHALLQQQGYTLNPF
ncbi:MAG: intracellular sulfur oxidation DsrE/DsrF family protein [Paraglaciecola sp.]|jgi:intracellular sulfur oxidation DsrE/DsrF family protein